MKALSYAKINLTLDVYRPQPNTLPLREGEEQKNNNFHTLQTIFHKISLADKIEIHENKDFKIV
jgi:4-diphosphocytidyl-2C-methyl-D-erythritol kinase